MKRNEYKVKEYKPAELKTAYWWACSSWGPASSQRDGTRLEEKWAPKALRANLWVTWWDAVSRIARIRLWVISPGEKPSSRVDLTFSDEGRVANKNEKKKWFHALHPRINAEDETAATGRHPKTQNKKHVSLFGKDEMIRYETNICFCCPAPQSRYELLYVYFYLWKSEAKQAYNQRVQNMIKHQDNVRKLQ